MSEGRGGQDERERMRAEIARLQAMVLTQQRRLETLSTIQHAYAALEQERERYRALVQATSEWVWSVNVRGNWGREVDDWWEQVTGQNMEDAEGWGWLGVVHPDDREPTWQKWLQILENPAPFRHEYRLHTRNGEYRWYAASGVPLWNPDGSVREWIGMLTDIHARRTAEEELKVLERAVLTSPVGFAFSDLAGRLTKVNPAFLRLFGYDQDAQVVGHFISEFGSDPSQWPAIRAAILINGAWKGERVGVRKDGSCVVVDVVASLVHDAQGKPQSLMASFLDITAQKWLSEQLHQARKLESIGRLAGGVAHDFNNLLAAILGFAEMAEETLPADATQRSDLANIRKAAGRAADLIRQLLAFARKEATEPKIIRLSDIITDDETILRRLIGEEIELSICLEPKLWEVKADPGQITQILVNLAVNARDAMPEGGKLTITVINVTLGRTDARLLAKDTPGDYVLVRVRDTGMGMTSEVQAHLFEPFYTTKEPDRGTGLGLATVYGIVKQNGGHITVDSAPGEGTTFSIYLPRVTASAAAEEDGSAG